MKKNVYGGIEHYMEPGKLISLGLYDTWVPIPDEVESIFDQILRVSHSH